MLKKVYIFTISYLCLLIFLSVSCNYNVKEIACFSVDNISLEHIDNSGIDEKKVENNTCTALAYALKISINSSGKICMFRNNNLINSAYALKKRTYKDVISESVKSINVYSLNDFDSTHLAGVSLNSYFRTKGNKRIENKMLVEKYVNNLDVKQVEITYYLFARPTLDSMHSFVVELVNNENEIFRDTTTTINLTK